MSARSARLASLCCALLLTACGIAAAQGPGEQPYPPTPISESEAAFALSLSTMPLDQAKAAISAADPALRSVGSAIALRNLGFKSNTAHPDVALAIYQEALEIAHSLHDDMLIGNLLQCEGDVYRFTGDLETALNFYDDSIAAYAANDPTSVRLALPLSSRSLTRRAMGDLDGAVEDTRIVLAKNEEAGDQIGMARALNNLGNVELILGNYQEAREDFERGLVLARAQKQRLGEAFLLNNIADTYLQEDNPTLATEYCLQSIKIKEDLGSKDDLVSSLVNLARIYHTSARPIEEQQTLDRALALAQASKRPLLLSLVQTMQGGLEIDLKHYDAALQHFNDALASARKAGSRTQEYEVLNELADLEFAMKNYAASARDAEAVLDFAVNAGFQQFVAQASDIDGRAQLQLGNIAKSRSAFEASVAAYERLRENTAGGDDARSQYLAHHIEPYQSLAALDISNNRLEDALQVSEREKGRTLLDLLTRGKSSLSRELTPQEKAQENHLRARLTALETQRRNLALEKTPTPSRLTALDQQLTTAHTAMGSFKEHMSAAHPDLDRHRGDANLITLAQTKQLLPNASTAILEYEVTPAATYLFVITPGRDGPALHLHIIAISSSALTASVGRFSKALAARDQGFAAHASELYRLLIAPAKTELARTRTLIIVPSGDLWHLPFQALRDPAGKYLLDTAAISYAPSLSVLYTYVTQRHSTSTGHSLLAFGDPADNLPESAREARTVAALYNPANTRTFIGNAATMENFRTFAAHYDIVHLATHGLFDDDDPMYSHLLLAGADSSHHNSAQLDASEIADMKMSAALVVLSACETADGKYRDGEGLIGLSWSFLAAGSQSAIASQWRVESSSTTELMIAFHRNLQQHMGKAEALRRAELTLAHTPRYDHPFYWAGFVLLGVN